MNGRYTKYEGGEGKRHGYITPYASKCTLLSVSVNTNTQIPISEKYFLHVLIFSKSAGTYIIIYIILYTSLVENRCVVIGRIIGNLLKSTTVLNS